MQASQLAKAYKSNAVSTVSPGAIILLLMDGVLSSLANALEGFDFEHPVKRNEQIHNNLIKGNQIVAVLQAALDLEVEGDFPGQMYALYDFMMAELTKANTQKSSEPIKVVKGLMQDIRDAWAEMLLKEMAAE